MGKHAEINVETACQGTRFPPVSTLIKRLPFKLLLPISQAPGLSPAIRQAVEQRLGACMKYLAEKEGHAPALAEQVKNGLSAGLTLSEVARCLDIDLYQADCLTAYEIGGGFEPDASD